MTSPLSLVPQARPRPLRSVLRELAAPLGAIETRLSEFAEGGADPHRLATALPGLMQARDVFALIELLGPQMLAAEMCLVIEGLLEDADEQRQVALEALMAAAVELPRYVERVEAGAPDVPLLLLAPINELRAVRGAALVSEAAMLLPELRLPRDDERPVPRGQLEAAVAEVRQRYLRALLALLRERDPGRAVAVLAWAFKVLRDASTLRSARMLWLIGRGLVDGLRAGSLAPSPAIKGLLGQLDRCMKVVERDGEAALPAQLPPGLLKNLLYYCGRAGDASDVLKLIRQRYRLNALLPPEHSITSAREAHAAPPPALLAAAREAIDGELSQIKDALEAHAHNERADPQELLPLPMVASKLCDSLTVLGLADSRALLAAQLPLLRKLPALSRSVAVPRLHHIAHQLLLLEQSIEVEIDQLQAEPGAMGPGAEIDADSSSLTTLPRAEWQAMLTRVAAELLSLCARLREAYIAWIGAQASGAGLEAVLPQCRDAVGILTVLPLRSARDVVARLGDLIERRYLGGQLRPGTEEQRDLAEAVAAFELYLEMLRSGERDARAYLRPCYAALQRVEQLPLPAPARERAPPPRAAAGDNPAPLADPALVETFVDEAQAVAADIQSQLRAWRAGEDVSGALGGLRRSFHTLKGSGRFVGAHHIGEMGWAVENLLNQKLGGSDLDPDPALVLVIEQALQALPGLISALASDRDEPGPALAVIEHANRLCASGAARGASLGLDDTLAAAGELTSELPRFQRDAVLRDIFVRECRGHLAAVRRHLADRTDSAGGLSPDQTLSNLLHSLNGSARTAQAGAVAALVGPVDSLLGHYRESHRSVPAIEMALVGRAFDSIECSLQSIEQGETGDPAAARLVRELRGISAQLDREREQNAGPVSEELREVFVEEAGELLQAGETALQAWLGQPADGEARERFKRVLHTLKGSARMSGYQALADVAHAMESAIARAELLSSLFSEAELARYQEALDALNVCLDGMRKGDPVADLAWLLAALDGKPPALEQPPASAPEGPERGADGVEPATGGDCRELNEALGAAGQGGDDTLRIGAAAIGQLIQRASEVNILRATLADGQLEVQAQLNEFNRTVKQLRERLRALNHSVAMSEAGGGGAERLQEIALALGEGVADLDVLHASLRRQWRIGRATLDAQQSAGTELQDALMKTRLVRFDTLRSRLERVVRQSARALDKSAKLVIEGGDCRLDRVLLSHLTAPLEHLVRNAVVHGIETPAQREAAGKLSVGSVIVRAQQEGGDVLLRVVDDGAGIDLARVRAVAQARELIAPGQACEDQELAQLLLVSGFSTAEQLSQDAGRGVGLDVVNRELKAAGGALSIQSQPQVGSLFEMRLPLSLAIEQVMLVRAGSETFAVPLKAVVAVQHVSPAVVRNAYINPAASFAWDGGHYRVRHLGELLGVGDWVPNAAEDAIALVLVDTGEQRVALHVDALIGRREIPVRPGGEQLRQLRAWNGASVLADGQVVLVLNIAGLLLERSGRVASVEVGDDTQVLSVIDESLPTVMVVDDSITIRKVTAGMLERNGYRVITARDGIEALEQLRQHQPAALLLDLEMPRMDGFELCERLRGQSETRALPLVVISSRSGTAQRERAAQFGVHAFFGKPYQEQQLLDVLAEIVGSDAREAS